MRTPSELMVVMRDHMLPQEIVEAVGISAEDLVEVLEDWVGENYEQVESGLRAAGFEE